MNYKLLIKHIESAVTFAFPELAKDGSNANSFFCADVVGSRRFALNYGGYPASEIAELNRAVSIEEQMNILQTLTDYSPSSNPNAGMSDAEIMLGHRSKYLQTPSETIKWLEGQIANRDAKRFADSSDGDKNNSNIDFNPDDAPNNPEA